MHLPNRTTAVVGRGEKLTWLEQVTKGGLSLPVKRGRRIWNIENGTLACGELLAFPLSLKFSSFLFSVMQPSMGFFLRRHQGIRGRCIAKHGLPVLQVTWRLFRSAHARCETCHVTAAQYNVSDSFSSSELLLRWGSKERLKSQDGLKKTTQGELVSNGRAWPTGTDGMRGM